MTLTKTRAGLVNERSPELRRRGQEAVQVAPGKSQAFLANEMTVAPEFSSSVALRLMPPKTWLSLGSQFNCGFDSLVN